MRFSALAVALALVGCASKSAPKAAAVATLDDITLSSTLAAVRVAFNTHKGEARFLTLLAPT